MGWRISFQHSHSCARAINNNFYKHSRIIVTIRILASEHHPKDIILDSRFARIRETGNLGICEPVGEGAYELKFDFGPGYRIYFGLETDTFMILLLGGSKKRQQKDINKSKEYWKDHLLIKRGKK